MTKPEPEFITLRRDALSELAKRARDLSLHRYERAALAEITAAIIAAGVRDVEAEIKPRKHQLSCNEYHEHGGLDSDCHSDRCWCRESSSPAAPLPASAGTEECRNRTVTFVTRRCDKPIGHDGEHEDSLAYTSSPWTEAIPPDAWNEFIAWRERPADPIEPAMAKLRRDMSGVSASVATDTTEFDTAPDAPAPNVERCVVAFTGTDGSFACDRDAESLYHICTCVYAHEPRWDCHPFVPPALIAEEIADAVVQCVCDSDPADPERPDTLKVSVETLRHFVKESCIERAAGRRS